MKLSRRHARHALLSLAALLLLAPAAATAQRRRPSPRRAAPPASAAPAAPAAQQSPQQETERPFDTTVAADSYAFYVEVRNLGRLALTNEIKSALGAVRLVGDAPHEVTDLIDFLTANEEALATVRVVAAAVPAREGVPQGIMALHFPTPDGARLFEPKLRAFLDAVDAPPPAAAPAPRGRGASRRARPRALSSRFFLKRAGSWLYGSDQAFTFKSLKGDGANLLADHARLQAFRSRLANESVFVYYDVAVGRTGWQLQMDKVQKQQEELARAQATVTTATTATAEGLAATTADPMLMPEDERPIPYGDPNSPPPPDEVSSEVVIKQGGTVPPEEAATPEPTPEVGPGLEVEGVTTDAETGEKAVTVAPSPRSDEERAARALMNTLLSGVFGGGLREPEAVGVGVGLEGDMIAARVLVARAAGDANNIIPFFPHVVSGPPVAPESFSIAPADSEVFVTASFDWASIYESLLAGMNRPMGPAAPRGDVLREGGENDEPDARMQPASAEKSVEAMEKLFGFSIREDLLPAFGNEVAVSTPVDWFEGRRGVIAGAAREAEGAGEKPAKAGPVALVSLNNPEAARRIVPLLLTGMGLPVQPLAATERRKGFEVQDLGALAYAFVDNFLVVGENAPAVRHVIDAYSSNQTLAASNRFREAVAWQEPQRLALAYLSDDLMRGWVDGAKKMGDGSEDPVVHAALAQLDVPLSAASYAATNEGDALLHELRLPVGLVKVFAASTVIGTREAPVLGNETFATYALQRIHTAQEAFKVGLGKGRYGSLEELYEAKLLDKEYETNQEYAYDVRASGDKFTATATPKNYGKTGRRSFYTDETGVVRAANHKGEPATAADPPVDR